MIDLDPNDHNIKWGKICKVKIPRQSRQSLFEKKKKSGDKILEYNRHATEIRPVLTRMMKILDQGKDGR